MAQGIVIYNERAGEYADKAEFTQIKTLVDSYKTTEANTVKRALKAAEADTAVKLNNKAESALSVSRAATAGTADVANSLAAGVAARLSVLKAQNADNAANADNAKNAQTLNSKSESQLDVNSAKSAKDAQNSAQLGGIEARFYSRWDHHHNSTYAPLSHDHGSTYAPLSHDHGDKYQIKGDYATKGHTHSQYLTNSYVPWSGLDSVSYPNLTLSVGSLYVNNVKVTSSAVLKENVAMFDGAADMIKGLNIYCYTRKDTGEQQIGLIIEDESTPDAVISGDRYASARNSIMPLALDEAGAEEIQADMQDVPVELPPAVELYSFASVLAQGLKESLLKIDELEAKIAALESGAV